MADPEFIHIHPVASAKWGPNWQRSIAHAEAARSGTVDDLLGDGPYRHQPQCDAGVHVDPLPARDAHRQAGVAVRSDAARGSRAGDPAVDGSADDRRQRRGRRDQRPARRHTFSVLLPRLGAWRRWSRRSRTGTSKSAVGVSIVPLALASYVDDSRLWPAYPKNNVYPRVTRPLPLSHDERALVPDGDAKRRLGM